MSDEVSNFNPNKLQLVPTTEFYSKQEIPSEKIVININQPGGLHRARAFVFAWKNRDNLYAGQSLTQAKDKFLAQDLVFGKFLDPLIENSESTSFVSYQDCLNLLTLMKTLMKKGRLISPDKLTNDTLLKVSLQAYARVFDRIFSDQQKLGDFFDNEFMLAHGKEANIMAEKLENIGLKNLEHSERDVFNSIAKEFNNTMRLYKNAYQRFALSRSFTPEFSSEMSKKIAMRNVKNAKSLGAISESVPVPTVEKNLEEISSLQLLATALGLSVEDVENSQYVNPGEVQVPENNADPEAMLRELNLEDKNQKIMLYAALKALVQSKKHDAIEFVQKIVGKLSQTNSNSVKSTAAAAD